MPLNNETNKMNPTKKSPPPQKIKKTYFKHKRRKYERTINVVS